MTPRREFFRAGLRYAGLSALGLLAVNLSGKQRCRRMNPCDGCSQFSGCDLPKAKQARADGGQPDSNHV